VFNVLDIALADAGHLPPDKIRQFTLDGVVDTGATSLVLPLNVVQILGLKLSGKASVTYADRRTEMRDMTDFVYLKIGDRGNSFSAVVEPTRKDALIGAVVMEALDLLVDCKNFNVIPRDKNFIIAEVE
jgi:predicted aspartyl protease